MNPSLVLEVTAFRKDQLISPDIPQIALAGRSNVGKSSLINALANRKQLAKVSSTPGKTRSINYYSLKDPYSGYIVDLPGYGYARCSQEERKKWAKLMEYYLSNTPGLHALAILLDSRLPPQKLDKQLISFSTLIPLPILPILTKADKCSKKELDTCITNWQNLLGSTQIIVTSAEKKTGIDSLWSTLLGTLSTD